MKNPEEYLKGVTALTLRKDLYKIGKQIQEDAYNQALEDVQHYVGITPSVIETIKKVKNGGNYKE